MLKKIAKFLLGALVVLILIGLFVDTGPDIEVNEELVVDYDIAFTEKDNFDRHAYQVVINEQSSVEEIEETAKEIANHAAKEEDYTALNIYFMDRQEYSTDFNGWATLGTVRYWPPGGYGDAVDLEPGDYEALEFEFEHIRKKDWEQRPTQEEAEIFMTWDYIDWELYDLHEGDEEEIYEMTANELGTSVAEVKYTVNKVYEWVRMGGPEIFDD